jgi:hypothetical protein
MNPLAALGLAIEQGPPREADAASAQDAAAARTKTPFSGEFQSAAPAQKDATTKSRFHADEATATDGVDQALIFLAEIEPAATRPAEADADIPAEGDPEGAQIASGDAETPEIDAFAIALPDARGTASIKAMPPFLFEPQRIPGARAINDAAGVLTTALDGEIKVVRPGDGDAVEQIKPRIMMDARDFANFAAPAPKVRDAVLELPTGAIPTAGFASAQGAAAPTAPALIAAAAIVSPAHQILAAVTANRDADTVEVRLEPPDLGRVRIHFSFERADVVVATLSSERGETLDLMRRHASDLVRELERSGFGRVQLDFQSGRGSDFATPRSAPSEVREHGAIDAADDDQPLYFIRRSDKLLDRRV